MNMLPFFCEMHDFFLTFENIRQNTSYPGNTVKNVDVPEDCIPAKS